MPAFLVPLFFPADVRVPFARRSSSVPAPAALALGFFFVVAWAVFFVMAFFFAWPLRGLRLAGLAAYGALLLHRGFLARPERCGAGVGRRGACLASAFAVFLGLGPLAPACWRRTGLWLA